MVLKKNTIYKLISITNIYNFFMKKSNNFFNLLKGVENV